jgi:hypothetical protein|tara:strand:+ start:1659 stop:1886 length:228 start_codon:yes stop_codon:yes gene_type:complete
MEQSESVMSKRTAKQFSQCREVVQEVMDFGVNELMILQIINLLALELDNRVAIIEISDIVKKYLTSDDNQSDLIL